MRFCVFRQIYLFILSVIPTYLYELISLFKLRLFLFWYQFPFSIPKSSFEYSKSLAWQVFEYYPSLFEYLFFEVFVINFLYRRLSPIFRANFPGVSMDLFCKFSQKFDWLLLYHFTHQRISENDNHLFWPFLLN